MTAGNASASTTAPLSSSSPTDVAARAGQRPMARLAAYALAGVPNEIMGEGRFRRRRRRSGRRA